MSKSCTDCKWSYEDGIRTIPKAMFRQERTVRDVRCAFNPPNSIYIEGYGVTSHYPFVPDKPCGRLEA
jgi:hypothetical protein